MPQPPFLPDAEKPTQRQTLSYLQQLFEGRGLNPKSKLGQCFLVDLNLMDLVVRSAELDEHDLAVEVGSGTGALTLKLTEHAGAVVGIEVDKGFYRLADDLTRAWANVKVLHGDALKNKNALNPVLLDAIHEARRLPGIERVKLVANLPYLIATPVVTNILLLEDLPLERMVVMVQLEMAARLAAKPSTKDYNASSIFVQSLCTVEVIRKIGPRAFYPPPKVDSAIIRVTPRPERRQRIIEAVGSVGRFHRFLHGLYLHRRKNLRGTLLTMFRPQFDKPAIDQRLAEAGYDGTRRAEELTIDEHIALCQAFPDPRDVKEGNGKETE
jgi:16S rRNA (adenine1518-N6/adenine1519-N6)-dimethyltransferase